MSTQRSYAIAILAAICFITLTEAAPLSHQNQLQVALEKIAELKGDTFNSCCNVRPFFYVHVCTYRSSTLFLKARYVHVYASNRL